MACIAVHGIKTAAPSNIFEVTVRLSSSVKISDNRS